MSVDCPGDAGHIPGKFVAGLLATGAISVTREPLQN
jgi:hypothetical protein